VMWDEPNVGVRLLIWG